MASYLRLYIVLFSVLTFTLFWSCSSDSSNDGSGNNNPVSNLTVTIDVVGTDASNPNGNGSGVVNITATATNAVNYGFKFGNEAEQQNTSGTIQRTYDEVGTGTYSVRVYAYSSNNESISLLQSFTVYVEDTSITAPSNLSLTTSVVGADTNNPYGDGSGVVNFSAQATNAVSYGYIIDNESEVQSTDGTFQYTFNDVEGVENHDVTVIAYSSNNESVNSSETVAVSYYLGTPPTWADEFFQAGAPDSEKWTYDLGAGGWGNNEVQTYTNSNSNVKVEDGLLKIMAKAEGSGYTSSRLKSQGLYQFTYGRVDVRAKLPSATGTWPAIWMLGANFPSVGWPNCGEIDIMEQTGWDKNKVLGTCHWYDTASAGYAGYGLDTNISNASTEFHVYSVEWNSSSIKIFVDNVQYYVISSSNSAIPNSPFQSDFFLILNIAMGGSLGGTIDSNFTEDSMEIDYVRVYQ